MASSDTSEGSSSVERRLSLTDAEVVLAYSLALLAAAVMGRSGWVAQLPGVDPSRFLQFADLNAGEALTLAAVVSLSVGARATLSLTSRDLIVLAAAASMFLPPAPHPLPFLGATLAGAYFWRTRRDCAPLVSLSQLWIAIAAHVAWGPLAFRIVSVPVLHWETLAIAEVGKLLGMGLTVDGAQLAAPSGWSVYILDPCSSFHNLSLAALVWLALLKLGREPVGGSAWAALVTGGAFIILLNVARILLMTLSEPKYEYWHIGLGRSFFTCLTLAAIALPTLLSMRGSLRLQAPGTLSSR